MTFAGTALALLLAAGGAQAQSISTAHFDISTAYAYDSLGMQVLSDTGSAVSISLSSFMPPRTLDLTGGFYAPSANGMQYETGLTFDVADGYRITSLTFSGTAVGTVHVTPPPDLHDFEIPFAHNAAYISWTDVMYGNGTSIASAVDVNGTEQFSGTLLGAIEGEATLHFFAGLYNSAMSYGDYVWNSTHEWLYFQEYPAFASIAASNIVMTVQVAAVPEPGTYAMLLAGLGLVGIAARRRNSGMLRQT